MQATLPPASAAEPEPPGAARLGAIVLATSAAVMMLNVAPAVEQLLRREGTLSPAQIGMAFAIELAAMALASLPARAWLGRVDESLVARGGHGLFLLGNLLAIGSTHEAAWYVGARAIAGLGAGTLMVLGLSLVARMPRCERWYALVTLAQIATGALLLYGLASVTNDPLQAFFLAAALAAIIGFASAGAFARGEPDALAPLAAAALSAPGPHARGLRVLALTLAFNGVIGGLWPFLAGYAADMAPARVDADLALATVAGLAGAAVSYVIAGRFPLHQLLLAGHAGMVLGAGLLHVVRTPPGFMAGCCVLSLGWNFCVPQVLAAVARQEPRGHLMPHANATFALGLAIGPLWAGWLIAAQGIDVLFACAVAGLGAGLALGWPALREPRA